MESTTLSDRTKPKTAAVSMTVGILEVLGSDGEAASTWRLTQPRCTVGSSNESLISVDDGSMAAVHALIVFGKNHTLIRAMGGQVRVSGRSVREWLIDEPTAIQCGATRFVVYPVGHQPNARSASHRVSAGNVADQASRLRTATSVQTTLFDDTNPTNEQPCEAVESTSATAISDSLSNGAASPGPPAFVVAKLDPDSVKSALEPLHIALQAASDGITELTRRANESAAQVVDIPPINTNLTEMTHAIETLEDRVASISSYCENLLVNVTESIEGRLSRFDELLLKLAERPDVKSSEDSRESHSPTYESALGAYDPPIQSRAVETPSYESPTYETPPYEQTPYEQTPYEDSSHRDTSYEPSSFANAAVEELPGADISNDESEASAYSSVESSYFSEPEDVSGTTSEHSNFDFNSYSSQVSEAEVSPEPEPSKPELPSWFTEQESGEASDTQPSFSEDISSDDNPDADSSEADSSETAWSTAQLNPIYAEDSNGWLAETEASSFRQELELKTSDLESLLPVVDEEFTARAEVTSLGETGYRSPLEIVDEEATETEQVEPESTALYDEVEEETYEPVGENEETEESIEDYMARLLQRVKGGTDADAPPSKASSIPTKSRETMTAQSPSTEQTTIDLVSVNGPETPESRPEQLTPTGFAPRQAAPEKSVDLAVLRNLANDTARQALHNSSRKKNELVLIGKIAIAFLGLGGAILLLVLNGFRVNVALIGMIASFVVFLLWGYEAVVHYKVLQASKVKEASDNANSESR